MAILKVSKMLFVKRTEEMATVLDWIEREYNCIIVSIPNKYCDCCYLFRIECEEENEDIPKGIKFIGFQVKEVVSKVLAISLTK